MRDIIAKTKEIYPLLGGVYNSTEMIWRFESCAVIQLAYFDTLDRCASMTQGAEYATVIMDEAMHWETDEVYNHLLSRLRNNYGMQPIMRLTSNPGKYMWVRDAFRIPDNGESQKFSIDYKLDDGTIITKKFQYIQAKLTDNPHLPREYQAQLMMLPEQERRALLDGDWTAWDTVDGQVFEHEIKNLNAENRYCHVAHDPSVPVHTYWDIGSSDMTVILFVQFVGKEIRIIDMIKDNNKGLNDYYLPEVMKRTDDLGYRYARHNFPHDAGQREWTNNTKIIDQVRKVTNDAFQLPRDRLADGIQSAKAMFANIWINKVKCEELYSDLCRYRREYDEKLGIYSEKPLHDKHSHSADAFRYISYYKPVTLQANDITPGRSASPFTYSR